MVMRWPVERLHHRQPLQMGIIIQAQPMPLHDHLDMLEPKCIMKEAIYCAPDIGLKTGAFVLAFIRELNGAGFPVIWEMKLRAAMAEDKSRKISFERRQKLFLFSRRHCSEFLPVLGSEDAADGMIAERQKSGGSDG